MPFATTSVSFETCVTFETSEPFVTSVTLCYDAQTPRERACSRGVRPCIVTGYLYNTVTNNDDISGGVIWKNK
jgi:hypothetical protein